MFKLAAAGTMVWLVINVAFAERIGVIDSILLIGPLVAVPLALPFYELKGRIRFILTAQMIVTGLLATAGLIALEWRLILPYIAFSIVLTAVSAETLFQKRTLANLLLFGAAAYLATAAVWLAAWCADITFLGFEGRIVELTSAHFHFAGFAAVVIASRVAHANRSRLAVISTLLVGGAPLIVATGHMTAPIVELLGGIVTTVALLLMGLATWRTRIEHRVAKYLLRAGSFVIILPMALAIQYGWHEFTDTDHLPYDTIAAIHGSMNAIGFACAGIVGWRLNEGR